jgi:drug/metabolite transporter (DMT)-like permease
LTAWKASHADRANKAAAFTHSELRAVSLLLAALLLGQALTALRLFGGVLILSAVILLSRGALRASEAVS